MNSYFISNYEKVFLHKAPTLPAKYVNCLLNIVIMQIHSTCFNMKEVSNANETSTTNTDTQALGMHRSGI